MPPTDEHAVIEQRVDGGRAWGASSVGSKPVGQRGEHAVDEKNVVPLKAQRPTNCKLAPRAPRRSRRRRPTEPVSALLGQGDCGQRSRRASAYAVDAPTSPASRPEDAIARAVFTTFSCEAHNSRTALPGHYHTEEVSSDALTGVH